MRVRIPSIRAVVTSAVLVMVAGSSIAFAGDGPARSAPGAEASVARAVPPEATPSAATPSSRLSVAPMLPAAQATPSSPPSVAPMLPAARATSSATAPVPVLLPRDFTTAAAPTASPTTTIALVPIVGFWSDQRSISRDGLAAILAGTDRTFRRVVVADRDRARLAAVLGVQPGADVAALSAEDVLEAVRGTTDTIGIVRAGDVRPSVRALDVDGRSLFGNGRVSSIVDWPLLMSVASAAVGQGSLPFDPAGTWTLVAAGDVMNDREVHRRTVLLGAGADFPWDGGSARIVSRTCCRAGETTVTAERTGNAGAVRALFRDADISLVNHEGPAPDRPVYHPHGLVFSFDARLEAGIRDAGVDIVSLANNHIRNAGSDGVVQTIRNVEAAGLTPVGAGKNARAARRPVVTSINGTRVAFLAYDAINIGAAGATVSRPGAAPLDLDQTRADIRAAREAGAQVVAIVPHWGVEYTDRPTTIQRQQAAALVAAGADIIIGSHSHWVGAMEAIDDGVVLYSLGDFIFDLARSEQTEEGLIAEMTFTGARLAQIDLHPTIQLDRSQPNLLEARDRQVILDRIRKASGDRLGW